ncbi:endonuclease [Sediminitomix flava]|uniref:Endonuclease I n=1 Tax=Sediminitomix flava TaxID=379075 RepID=A0A315ZCC2_SEDFL|nr:endonuclease [Sediminitomix flava]PWJ43226.1 endonuclease I [Sediminitomix flava]
MFLSKLKSQLIIWLLSLPLFIACVDQDFDNPNFEEPSDFPDGTATITIAELKALHEGKSDSDTVSIPDNAVIVGQVISSDQAGNIYKELYIQDETGGILMRVDANSLYNSYKLGQEIAVNCGQLVVGSYGGNKQLGIPSIYNNAPAAGRIPLPMMKEMIQLGAVKELQIKTATVSELQSNLSDYLGHLVHITNIEVASSDKGKTFADAENQTTQNRYFNDGTSASDVVLRTSGYSDFAGEKIPSGALDMIVIVSSFNGTPQLYINSLDDITGGSVTDPDPEDGNVVFSENFDTWTDGEVNQEGWLNINTKGNTKWVKESKAGHYVAFSPYNSGDAESEGWLILPQVNGNNLYLQFNMAVGFMVDGHTDVMRLMISKDFNGQDLEAANWVDITDQVNLPTNIGDANGDFWQWETSLIDLSQYAGNANIAFVYKGSDVQSTKLEIDNIVITNGKPDDGTPVDPGSYYGSAEGKTGYALKTALHQIISSNTTVLSYGDLWDAFYESDAREDDSNKVWDMYSYSLEGEFTYEYEFGTNQCGNTPGYENGCYNREHSFPTSWFGGKNYPMYTDLVHIVPTDSYVNSRRSNYPYGEVSSASWVSENGGQLGSNNTNGYSSTVFEPIDEYKGDFARIYFYMATRYQDQIANWDKNSSQADAVLNGTSDQVFEDWQLDLLLKWHYNDPVSDKEIKRNEAIYKWQNNRNPFVDHPEWVEEIWPTEQASRLAS